MGRSPAKQPVSIDYGSYFVVFSVGFTPYVNLRTTPHGACIVSIDSRILIILWKARLACVVGLGAL